MLILNKLRIHSYYKINTKPIPLNPFIGLLFGFIKYVNIFLVGILNKDFIKYVKFGELND